MSDELVEIGSFPTMAEAHFIQSHLEEAGIRAFVDGEAAANLGFIAGAMGEARVLVPQGEAKRALALLNELMEEDEPPASPAPREGITDRPARSSAITTEPDEEETAGPRANPREEAAERSLTAALFGLIFCPLHLYVTLLLLQVWASDEPLGDRYRWRAWVALLLNLPMLVGMAIFLYSVMVD